MIKRGTERKYGGIDTETEQDLMVFHHSPHVLSLPFVSGKILVKNKFKQRNKKMQKIYKTKQVQQTK